MTVDLPPSNNAAFIHPSCSKTSCTTLISTPIDHVGCLPSITRKITSPDALCPIAVLGAMPQPPVPSLIVPSPFTIKNGEKETASRILFFIAHSAVQCCRINIPS